MKDIPRKQQEYWSSGILSWEEGSYSQAAERLPLIERLAGPFRGHLRERIKYGADVIRRLAPANVLELGCGSGRLLESVEAGIALRGYVGVDVAEPAIELARRRSYAATIEGGPRFLASSLAELNLADFAAADLVIGLGLLPYLDEEEMTKLLEFIKGRKFVMDFHNPQPSAKNALHWLYRKVKGHPFYRLSTPDEITQTWQRAGIAGFEVLGFRGLWVVQRLS